jgi:hypothetical protein
MNLVITGEWTGICEMSERQDFSMKSAKIVTLDGKSVKTLQQPGLYIIHSQNGKVHKVLR